MPFMPAIEEKLTIEPFLRGAIDCTTTCRIMKNSSLVLTAKHLSHASSVISSAAADGPIAAAVAAPSSSEWRNKNVQIVISAKIIGETWGPPQVLARYFW